MARSRVHRSHPAPIPHPGPAPQAPEPEPVPQAPDPGPAPQAPDPVPLPLAPEPEPVPLDVKLNLPHMPPRLDSLVASLYPEEVVEIEDFSVSSSEDDGGGVMPRVECFYSKSFGVLHITIDAKFHIEIPILEHPRVYGVR